MSNPQNIFFTVFLNKQKALLACTASYGNHAQSEYTTIILEFLVKYYRYL